MDSQPDETANSRTARSAPPGGRVLRLLVGAWLLFVVATNAARAPSGVALLMGATFAALLSLYVALHLFLTRRQLNVWLGKLIALVPVALVYFLGPDAVKLGVLAFFGTSLLVASLRGDPGCEVTTIPSLLLGRSAYLPCLIFSPLDRLEESLARRLRTSD